MQGTDHKTKCKIETSGCLLKRRGSLSQGKTLELVLVLVAASALSTFIQQTIPPSGQWNHFPKTQPQRQLPQNIVFRKQSWEAACARWQPPATCTPAESQVSILTKVAPTAPRSRGPQRKHTNKPAHSIFTAAHTSNFR